MNLFLDQMEVKWNGKRNRIEKNVVKDDLLVIISEMEVFRFKKKQMTMIQNDWHSYGHNFVWYLYRLLFRIFEQMRNNHEINRKKKIKWRSQMKGKSSTYGRHST